MAGTTAKGGRGRGGMIVGINVTPMVDVVLVLLVILMVSATWIVSQSMKVDLPNTATSDGSAASLAAVTIGPKGELLFNEKPVTEAELKDKLAEAGKKGDDVTLIVSADKSAMHGAVVHVLDLARGYNITKFAVQVEREGQ
ncbi:MAG: Biopolymer transport protein ExbD/TolR [Myxococcaceae bacterium]|nr:Biopolymer transport protein ExbD/TolR [Myxococcaceae bacterium]